MDLSIVILTWNRRAEVLETVRRTLPFASRVGAEVIVVDNGSTDGTSEALSSAYPQIDLVRLPSNRGASGWNAGLERARGEWVMTLDDDSSPEGDWAAEVAPVGRANRDAGILACRVLKGAARMPVTEGWGERTTDFIACGAIFRRTVFDRVGYYDPKIFLYSHEKEYALRVLAAGFDIVYVPDFLVYHRAAGAHRSSERYVSLGVEGAAYRIVSYYPLHLVPFALILMLMHHARWCRRHEDRISRYLGIVSRALARGVSLAAANRRPLPAAVRRRIASISRAEAANGGAQQRLFARLAPSGFFW